MEKFKHRSKDGFPIVSNAIIGIPIRMYLKTNVSCKPWTFGQFEAGILDVACHLLANDKRVNCPSGGGKLSSLVQVARILSAQTNVNEDNGVLVGNWSGEYADGKSPTSWNSSGTF